MSLPELLDKHHKMNFPYYYQSAVGCGPDFFVRGIGYYTIVSYSSHLELQNSTRIWRFKPFCSEAVLMCVYAFGEEIL